MTQITQLTNDSQSNAKGQLWLRGVVGPLVMFGLLFLSAGRWDYWQGWLYIGISVVLLLLMATWLSPQAALIEERLRPGAGMKTWDKVYFAISTPMYVICLVVAGVDVGRFGWTGTLPLWVYGLSVLLYLLGQGLFLWARYINHYFSSVVRIQLDRGQTVCREGPYRYVRHPGYVGGILFALAMPLLLGSLWALIPQMIAAGLLVWRTALEDRTLQAELPGYVDYMHATRYRLMPGLW